ncbi:glycosyltransferase [Luteibacter sp.]|jgi:glycosyltransferase involved in cell wall biosynthesis|uniref:glycosyltransferase n=1 Tax=Luteibacter sp. TaxID=1886636 RepID=UPI002F3F2B31
MTNAGSPSAPEKRTLLVLASTYPRWRGDHEPGFVHELCRRLATRFHVIALVPDAPGADPSGELDGVEVIRYRYAPRGLQTLVNDGGIASNLRRSVWKWLLVPGFVGMQYLSARRLISRRRVDAIHAHWLVSPGIVARLLASPALPYVVTSHGGDLFGFRHPLFAAIKRWVVSRAAAMTVVSAAMAKEVRRLVLPVEHLETIPMGVDMDGRFSMAEGDQRSTSALLFVGRLVAKKGLTHLLDAMPAILAVRPDVTLDIVGFGPERDSLQRQVDRLGLDRNVVFLGALPQEKLPALYRHASMFVAPFVRDPSGDQEGLPVALMEAVATGCPYVVGEVEGLDDLLGDSAGYFRVDPRDSSALTAAVLAGLADPVVAQVAASKAADRARQCMDWSIVVRRYGDLIERSMRLDGAIGASANKT